MNNQHDWKDDPRLVAYALEEWSELSSEDVAEIEGALESDPACREALDEVREVNARIARVLEAEPALAAAPMRAAADEPVLAGDARAAIALAARRGAVRQSPWRTPAVIGGLAAAAAAALVIVRVGAVDRGPDGPAYSDETVVADAEPMLADESDALDAQLDPAGGTSPAQEVKIGLGGGAGGKLGDARAQKRKKSANTRGVRGREDSRPERLDAPEVELRTLGVDAEQLDVPKAVAGAELGAVDRARGAVEGATAEARPVLDLDLKQQGVAAKKLRGAEAPQVQRELVEITERMEAQPDEGRVLVMEEATELGFAPATERVAPKETPFTRTATDPFSTFSVDVDTASYTAARASIANGRVPDPAMIRVEEFINYFSYGDAAPKAGDDRPFAVTVQTGAAPWAPEHRLVRIGMKARALEFGQRKRANLVFLVDVSGSMKTPGKLPLVKRALGILTESLHAQDRVAIAVYAGSEGLALESTPLAARESILQSLERLEGGGSTNAGAGIQLAYAVARDHFIEGGINRVVLCTDGDFNVGVTDAAELEELIAKEAATGVELTVLGFGGSSGGDERMETLSNRGNGNYALIDTEFEARKVLVNELGGTLATVASDVKLQVAWNPAKVAAFRLVGYENRRLAHRDFLDDTKDAGEIGAGHGVTALYEVVPAGVDLVGRLGGREAVAGLPAQDTEVELADVTREGEAGPGSVGPPESAAPPETYRGDGLVEVRLRYKSPGATESVGFGVAAADGGATFDGAPEDLRFSAAVATFAQLLRGAPEVKGVTFEEVRTWALEAKGEDRGGLREGFVQMVEQLLESERERAEGK